MKQTLKRFGKRVLPESWIFFYHSVRIARRLGIIGALLRTLPNAAHNVRLGGEGGWNIPADAVDGSSVCYCVGCGEDITFDLELIRRYGCTVYAFDPTPGAIAHVREHAAGVPQYKFHEVAIWEAPGTVRFYVPPVGVSHSITNLEGTDRYLEVPAKRLRQFVEEYGHDRIALLKMDIEGAEHTVIRTVLEDKLPVDVLCVEFDELAAHATPERIQAIHATIATLLDAGYEYFWIEGSNFTFRRSSVACSR